MLAQISNLNQHRVECLQSNLSMKPNLVEAGDLWVAAGEDTWPVKLPFSLLIQCESAEQVRDAIKTGSMEFTIFEHYEQ